MGTMLAALQHLQSVERQLIHVQGRLKTRRNAVAAQEKRISLLTADYTAINDKALTRRKDADRFELDLKQKEEQIVKLRGSLNTAKTNKEYAALLTQMNTIKADNAKLEEETLKIMAEVDVLKADAEKVKIQMDQEAKRLEEIQASSNQEITKLNAMVEELAKQRAEAAQAVSPDLLSVFDRIALSNEGDAMAVIEIHGRRPPFEYVCGGCFMSLNAEHANALRSRDEIRTCDNCGRILYLEPKTENSPA